MKANSSLSGPMREREVAIVVKVWFEAKGRSNANFVSRL